jgi:hypothetical protein
MELPAAANANAINAGLQNYFVYYGWMENENVPRDVTHVRIHSFVRAIKEGAFSDCMQLRIVILNKELEEIDGWTFCGCTSMEEIVVPNNLRTIKDMSFNHCHMLRRVTLGNGLVVIDVYAFSYCKLIEVIIIPNAVRVIKVGAFCGCRRLTRVILGEGLEEIGMNAFGECTSMVEIVIPSAVKDIDDAAFLGCTNLRRVKFCNKIEEFVSSHAMRVWWNQGRHERSFCTYRFLVRCRIPVRLAGLAPVSSWQANINDMLRIMPTIYNWDMDNYFDTINSRIPLYESWRQVPTLLGEIIPNNDTVLKILSYF